MPSVVSRSTPMEQSWTHRETCRLTSGSSKSSGGQPVDDEERVVFAVRLDLALGEEVGDGAMVELGELREFKGRERAFSRLDVHQGGPRDADGLGRLFLGESAILSGLPEPPSQRDWVKGHEILPRLRVWSASGRLSAA